MSLWILLNNQMNSDSYARYACKDKTATIVV